MANEVAVIEQKIAEIKAGIGPKITKLKWGALAITCVIIAPFVISGVIGIIGVFTMIALGIVGTQMMPVLAKRMANAKAEMLIAEQTRHLEAVKAMARKNPVETLQQQALEYEQALEATGQKIHKFATKVNSMVDRNEDFKRRFPEDANLFDQEIYSSQQLLQRRREKWQEAKGKLDAFYKVIERADAIWQMSLAANELRSAANDLQDTVMQRIQRETALDSVREAMAATRADLDQMMMEEVDMSATQRAQPSLTHNPSPSLNNNLKAEDAVIISTISREATSRRV